MKFSEFEKFVTKHTTPTTAIKREWLRCLSTVGPQALILLTLVSSR